jgi:hypothetical protein
VAFALLSVLMHKENVIGLVVLMHIRLASINLLPKILTLLSQLRLPGRTGPVCS